MPMTDQDPPDDEKFTRAEDIPSLFTRVGPPQPKLDAPDASRFEQTSADSEPKSPKERKAEKEDLLIAEHISHLSIYIKWGSYNEYWEPAHVTKMALIKSHMQASKHPKISEVRALYAQVVEIIRKTYSAPDVERWIKDVDDEIANSKARNYQNALKCPIASWSNNKSDGSLKPAIYRAIVAIRTLLEEKKFQLRHDVWKGHNVITSVEGKEEYPSQQVTSILRGWRNTIYERNDLFDLEVLKDAHHQIAKDNEFHSLQEKIKSTEWDGVDRYAEAAKAFGLKLTGMGEEDGLQFTARVFKQHLMASMARVFYPGVWYDLVLCIFGDQGAGKTTGLRILYGHDNTISCNFFELDPKVQSEKTRHGIACVENADTFGDARKADFNRIKADLSTDSYLGRAAYGRDEDTRRALFTYVVWYTGNEVRVLRDPTGNRRFIIVYSEKAVDEGWLRRNRNQLWAQTYKDMKKLRADYLEEMQRKGIEGDDYLKYLELPRDLWAEAKRRQDSSMVVDILLDDWLPEIIFQDFVVWPVIERNAKTGQITEIKGKKSIHFLTRDFLKYLQDKGQKTTVAFDQLLGAAMDKYVVMEKDKCEGLTEDIKWRRAQIKRKHANLRGYRIDFEGEAMEKAFEKLAARESRARLYFATCKYSTSTLKNIDATLLPCYFFL